MIADRRIVPSRFPLIILLILLIPSLQPRGHAQGSGDAEPRDFELPAYTIPSNVYCGIYSLAGALGLAGKPVMISDLVDLRYVDFETGSSIAQLKRAAEDFGLHAMAYDRLSVRFLRQSIHPIILHVKKSSSSTGYDHFELFLGTEDGMAKIYDAPYPLKLEPFSVLADRWSGRGLVVSSSPIDSKALLTPARMWMGGAIGLIAMMVATLYAFRRKLNSRTSELSREAFFRRSLVESVTMTSGISFAAMLFHIVSEDGLLAGAQSPLPVQSLLSDQTWPSLSAAEVTDLMDAPVAAVLVDARRANDYRRDHIEGAINVTTMDDSDARSAAMRDVPKEAKIIIYCQSVSCGFSALVAARLREDGYTDISLFPGGWPEWVTYQPQPTK